MANERLTDQTEITSKLADNDWVYVVDRSDTTDDADGSGFKMQIQNYLKGRTFQYILGCLVYKVNTSPTVTTIQDTDIVIYFGTNRLVIGKAIDAISSVPTDIDDANKFERYIDTSKLLP